MTPLVPEAYLEARRSQIIDAACKCFVDKGFYRATMQNICQEAKLSPGAVYNYFCSKDDIIVAMAEKSQKRNAEAISSAAGADKVDPLGKVVLMFLSMAKEHEAARAASLDLELIAESGRNHRLAKLWKKNMDAMLSQLAELVKRKQSEGVFASNLDPLAIAEMLFALFYGLVMQRILDPKGDAEAYIAVCEAIINGRLSKEDKKGE